MYMHWKERLIKQIKDVEITNKKWINGNWVNDVIRDNDFIPMYWRGYIDGILEDYPFHNTELYKKVVLDIVKDIDTTVIYR